MDGGGKNMEREKEGKTKGGESVCRGEKPVRKKGTKG